MLAHNLRVASVIIFTAMVLSLVSDIPLYVPALQDPKIPMSGPLLLCFWANQAILMVTVIGGLLTSPRLVCQMSPVNLETCVLVWVIMLIVLSPWTNWYIAARVFGREVGIHASVGLVGTGVGLPRGARFSCAPGRTATLVFLRGSAVGSPPPPPAALCKSSLGGKRRPALAGNFPIDV